MRTISIFAGALILYVVLISVGAWAVTTNQIDPLQMMANAKDLPSTQYVDHTLIFN